MYITRYWKRTTPLIFSANSHEVKQQRILLKVCSLNSTDFNKKEEEERQKKNGNNNLFFGEDDEKFHVFVSTISINDFSISNKIIDIKNHRMMCKKILISEDRLRQLKNLNFFNQLIILVSAKFMESIHLKSFKKMMMKSQQLLFSLNILNLIWKIA